MKVKVIASGKMIIIKADSHMILEFVHVLSVSWMDQSGFMMSVTLLHVWSARGITLGQTLHIVVSQCVQFC